jgi:phosphoribosylanthranilate isomerase
MSDAMKNYPRLKFCGMTREIDVQCAIEVGASAVGFNFVPASKRYIDPAWGAKLAQIADNRILRIGIFANSNPDEVANVAQICPLDAIQLHGNEGLDWLQESQKIPELVGKSVIRALPYRGREDDDLLATWSCEANDPESPVVAILVDAFDPQQMGGTGNTTRWDLLYPRPKAFFASPKESGHRSPPIAAPLILAGGIHPQNVADALRIARPEGIDLASGIELSPGIKDRNAMLAVSESVRSYFEKRAAEDE